MMHLQVAAALLLLRAAQAGVAQPGLHQARDSDSFDYIICGGGTSGLVLANRLSADSSVRVAVIEPGDDERGNANVSSLPAWGNTLKSHVNWRYESVPVNGSVQHMPAGKGIGGTSLINGMNYVRADKAEIDAWSSLGNDIWSWDALLPHYKSTMDFTRPSAEQVDKAGTTFDANNYGAGGELKVGFPREMDKGKYYALRRDTYKAAGIPKVNDVNGGSTRGFTIPVQTVDVAANVREDAARAFYWPIIYRPNLKMIKGTVTKVLWTDDNAADGEFTASGVQYLDENKVIATLDAKKEVILSAGAYRSPGILELSGVGNPRILKDLGIASTINLPGVGENLHDQPHVTQFYGASALVDGLSNSVAFGNAVDLFGDSTASVAEGVRSGIDRWAAAASKRTSGAIPESAYQTIFNVQHDLIFNKNVTIMELFVLGGGTNELTGYWPILPFSRGSVHLSSADASATDKPVIDNAFYQVDFDLQTVVAISKWVWKFWKTEPIFSGTHPVSDSPGSPYPANDDQWATWAQNQTEVNAHPIGTASMMSRDLGGVVDKKLKVYGTRNVRVVDASVLPLQLSGHPAATLYALADRAAGFIQGIE